METIIETQNITLDYDKSRENRDLGAYRLTLNDRYGHYDEDIYISIVQLKDLFDGLKDHQIDYEEEEFL